MKHYLKEGVALIYFPKGSGRAGESTHLDHGKEMFAELKRLGKNVTYWEVEGGTHCLSNHKDRMEMITDWLEK